MRGAATLVCGALTLDGFVWSPLSAQDAVDDAYVPSTIDRTVAWIMDVEL